MENRNMTLLTRRLSSVISALFKLLIIFIVAYPFVWMILTAFKPYKETVTYPP